MKKYIMCLILICGMMMFVGCGDQDNKNFSQPDKETSQKQREKDKFTEEEYKALCEKIDYKTIARNPEGSFLKKVYGTGEIIQVVEEDGNYASFRVNVTPVMNYDNTEVSYYQDTILIYTLDYNMNNRLLENDIIDFWGLVAEEVSYETVMGNSVTIPSVQMDYFTLK